MNKNATYRDKLQTLKPWLPALIEMVKRDLKNEHLKADWAFFKKYFPGKTPQKLTLDELVAAYSREVLDEGNEQLGEFIANRWLIKNTDVYDFFSDELTKISPNFDEIESIDAAQARQILKRAEGQVDPLSLYFFAVLNSVVFPDDVFRDMDKKAKEWYATHAALDEAEDQKDSVERSQRDLQLEISRITNRYEKKLAGMQKKYIDDTAALKKQIATLQRKLTGQPVDAVKG